MTPRGGGRSYAVRYLPSLLVASAGLILGMVQAPRLVFNHSSSRFSALGLQASLYECHQNRHCSCTTGGLRGELGPILGQGLRQLWRPLERAPPLGPVLTILNPFPSLAPAAEAPQAPREGCEGAGMSRKERLDAFGVSALFGVTLLLAFNQILVKWVNEGLQPVFFAGARSALAILFVGAWLWWRGRPPVLQRDHVLPGLLIGTVWGGRHAKVLDLATNLVGPLRLDQAS